MSQGYQIEQYVEVNTTQLGMWKKIGIDTGLTEAINRFRELVLNNPDTAFRLTAYAA